MAEHILLFVSAGFTIVGAGIWGAHVILKEGHYPDANREPRLPRKARGADRRK
jgi:hypothetical protein